MVILAIGMATKLTFTEYTAEKESSPCFVVGKYTHEKNLFLNLT